jgi:hypothetical protein
MLNLATATDDELTAERLRRLTDIETFQDLRERLVKPESIEIDRRVVASDYAVAQAEKMRAAGKIITIERAEAVGNGLIHRKYVVEHRQLPPLVECVDRIFLLGAVEEAFRQMASLDADPRDRNPKRRAERGRELLAIYVPDLLGRPADGICGS